MTPSASAAVNPKLTWGINLMPDAPVAEVAKVGARAEELGFGRCWLYDEGLATRDLYVSLTAIALATTRLEIGPGVTNPYTRHASVAAAATASLYELSGGRAFMALGAGGSLTLGPLGMQRSRPNVMLRDTITALRGLFSGEAANYDGEFVTLHRAQLKYADPAIPIWFAGRGPRMLATAAELADGISLNHIHEDFLDEHVAIIRDNAKRAGNEIELAYSGTLVTTDAELEHVREHMTYRLVDSPVAVKAAIGMTKSDTAALREAMSHGLDVAARLVKDDWVLPFVVHGTPADCAKQIAGFCTKSGIGEFTVPVTDFAAAEQTMSLASEIAGIAETLIAGGSTDGDL